MNENKKDYFDYLDGLRRSGIVNMFGAGKFLEEEFNLEKKESIKVLSEWMKTFSERSNKGE